MDKNIVYKPSGCFTFSVLIPCFNSESFIDQCLESVRSQTYQFWEVVVVDDGSTDNTAKHLRAVEEQLGSKMKVISQKNSGQLISRQAALASASGDYAIFLDADDMLRVDALEILSEALSSEPDALVQFKHSRVPSFDGEFFPSYPVEGTLPKVIDASLYRRWICSGSEFNPLWGKAIPMSAAVRDDDYREYSQVRNGEDLLQLVGILDRVEKVLLLDEPLYYYRVNPEGMASVFQPRFFDSVKSANKVLLEHIIAWNDEECYSLFWKRWLGAVYSSIIQMSRSKYSTSKMMDEFRRIASEEMFQKAWSESAGVGDKRDLFLKALVKGRYFLLSMMVRLLGAAKCIVGYLRR